MKYEDLSKRQQAYIDAIKACADEIGIDMNNDTFTRAELRLVSMKTKGKHWIPNWITHDQSRRVGRGMFSIPEAVISATDEEIEAVVDSLLTEPVMAGA